MADSADDAFRALAELFSDPRVPSRAHFRYPVDGAIDEFDRAFDGAMEEAFGPDKKKQAWVRRLHRLGLIGEPADCIGERGRKIVKHEVLTSALIDPPSPYDSLEVWEQHLSDLHKLPDTCLSKAGSVQWAEEMIAKKNAAIRMPEA